VHVLVFYRLSLAYFNSRNARDVRDQVSHPHKTTCKIIILCIFIFLDSKLEDERVCTEW